MLNNHLFSILLEWCSPVCKPPMLLRAQLGSQPGHPVKRQHWHRLIIYLQGFNCQGKFWIINFDLSQVRKPTRTSSKKTMSTLTKHHILLLRQGSNYIKQKWEVFIHSKLLSTVFCFLYFLFFLQNLVWQLCHFFLGWRHIQNICSMASTHCRQ